MHKFELVPMDQNGLDFLDASFSSSHQSRASTELDPVTKRSRRLAANNLTQQLMQVKATLIAQVNLQYECQSALSRTMTIGALKATLKNGIVEFYNNW